MRDEEMETLNTAGATEEKEENEFYVKFSKPYIFEEETYDGIDLSGLEDMDQKALTTIEKKYYKMGIASFSPENTSTYCSIVAQKATGMPIEFFEQLPLKETMKIKNKVVSFFYN